MLRAVVQVAAWPPAKAALLARMDAVSEERPVPPRQTMEGAVFECEAVGELERGE
jgi:hypothetical protein